MARKKRSKLGRPPKHEGELLSKNRTFRVRGTLDEQLEAAAQKAGRSVSEEIERRLEQSFRQQEIESELKEALDAQGRQLRDELLGEMQKILEAFQRARGLTDEEMQRPRPSLLDLAEPRYTEGPSEQPKGESGQPRDLRGSPDDTSEQPDRK
jgi:hypothetical protein